MLTRSALIALTLTNAAILAATAVPIARGATDAQAAPVVREEREAGSGGLSPGAPTEEDDDQLPHEAIDEIALEIRSTGR